jgi:hypothetical protein
MNMGDILTTIGVLLGGGIAAVLAGIILAACRIAFSARRRADCVERFRSPADRLLVLHEMLTLPPRSDRKRAESNAPDVQHAG